MRTHNWEEFFDKHAPHYMNNGFTANTGAEVDFVVEELGLQPASTVLDMGCGTGRHAIELARRGYRVTGVDISSGMLAEARKAAAAAGVHVEWIKCDAVQYSSTATFDAAVCLCEGAFGLVGRDEEPVERDTCILHNISAALKPQGRFMLTTLNAFLKIRNLTQEHIDSGRYNPINRVDQQMAEWDLPEGTVQVEVKERTYLPNELEQMFLQAGLRIEHFRDGTLGRWHERRAIQLDAIEIMVTAYKS